jgi:hypothetical protein
MASLDNGMSLMRVEPYSQMIIKGAILVAAGRLGYGRAQARLRVCWPDPVMFCSAGLVSLISVLVQSLRLFDATFSSDFNKSKRCFRLIVSSTVLLFSCSGLFAQATNVLASGRPGNDAHWPSAAKNGFGTSNTLARRLVYAEQWSDDRGLLSALGCA